MSGGGIGTAVGDLRNAMLRQLARILIKSGTFRRHLGAFDRNYDPDFLRTATLMRGATDADALFVRDLVNDARPPHANADQHQDLWVVHETARKRGGFFVEVGAMDGVTGSNTLLLEREFGWRGILAEPNPVWHANLARNRTARIDRRCVFKRSGDRVAFAATKHGSLATIAEFAASDGHARSRVEHEVLHIETVSLNELLASHDAPRAIDYVSIDTEGSELAILEAFDFGRWDVQLFSIEHNLTAREKAIDRLMESRGYERRFAGYAVIDSWYRKVC
jgi:FkbM family methyltransferase